ncbi:hypothetical protein J43TS9_55050 [Paenibacillus cineris]|nr:hypothetical protein J43TS9_55050 [Paenibacillus cineris]
MFREAGLQVAQEATLSAVLHSHRIPPLACWWGRSAATAFLHSRVVFPFLELAAVRGRNGKTKATAALFQNCGVRSAKQRSKCW